MFLVFVAWSLVLLTFIMLYAWLNSRTKYESYTRVRNMSFLLLSVSLIALLVHFAFPQNELEIENVLFTIYVNENKDDNVTKMIDTSNSSMQIHHQK